MSLLEYLCWVLVVGFSIFAMIWLINTYSADSYEYGNQVTVSDNLSFIIQLDTINLEQRDDKYSFSKDLTSAYQVDAEFNADKYNYTLLLNNNPLPNSKVYAGIAECNLPFTFLDARGEGLMSDTLYFSVQFNMGSTLLEMYTYNAEAVPYWESYFNAYGLEIRVYKEDVK